VGFTDAANFGRFFRSRTGLTPAAYAAREGSPGEVTSTLPSASG
jgi:AraC-like DNA-binding protein